MSVTMDQRIVFSGIDGYKYTVYVFCLGTVSYGDFILQTMHESNILSLSKRLDLELSLIVLVYTIN